MREFGVFVECGLPPHHLLALLDLFRSDFVTKSLARDSKTSVGRVFRADFYTCPFGVRFEFHL